MGVTVREKVKGSGVWWIFISHQGKRKSKKIGRDRSLALKTAEKLSARIVLGDLDMDTKATCPDFGSYARLWLDGSIKTLRRHSTYDRYRIVLTKNLDESFNSKPVDQITRHDIRNVLIENHRRGLSKATVRLIQAVLNSVFDCAVDEGIISINPASGIIKKLQLGRARKTVADFLTQDEIDLFLDTCSEHHPGDYPLFLLAFRTGMRMGEILGLKWSDINWNAKNIRVERSFKKGRITNTKTNRIRLVDTSDQLNIELKALHTTRKREALKTGRAIVEFIFHRHGNPMSQSSLTNIFKRILRRAGIRDIRFHDIRHTYASLLLSNGESPVYVKEQMGHSSISITVDTYGHLIPGSNREAVNRLDRPAPNYTLSAPKEN